MHWQHDRKSVSKAVSQSPCPKTVVCLNSGQSICVIEDVNLLRRRPFLAGRVCVSLSGVDTPSIPKPNPADATLEKSKRHERLTSAVLFCFFKSRSQESGFFLPHAKILNHQTYSFFWFKFQCTTKCPKMLENQNHESLGIKNDPAPWDSAHQRRQRDAEAFSPVGLLIFGHKLWKWRGKNSSVDFHSMRGSWEKDVFWT